MKYYVIVTGITFALLALAHAMRIYVEGTRLLDDPLFILTTGISLGFVIWAVLLLRRLTRRD